MHERNDMSHRYDRDDHSDTDAARREDPSWQTGYHHEDEDRDNRYGGRRSDLRSDLRSGRSGEGIRPNRDQDYNRYGNTERRYPPRDERGNSYYPPYYSSSGDYAARDRDYAGRDDRQSRGEGYPQGAGRYPDGYQPSERSPSVRGVYREQVWARDPDNGNVYGYGYTRRLPDTGANRDYERWRSNDDSSRRDWTGASREWGTVDALRTGGHSGKGPKGYVRSDERIREDVSDRLSDDDEVDASEITVTVSNGEVRLEGRVPDRHSKHRAEDIAESVSGVREVSNQLRAKKTFFQELGDKLSGEDDNAHQGHAGSGTRNSPSGIAPKNNVATSR